MKIGIVNSGVFLQKTGFSWSDNVKVIVGQQISGKIVLLKGKDTIYPVSEIIIPSTTAYWEE